MTAPTRKQVHKAISDAFLASGRSQVAGTDVFAAVDAVMALYADSQPKVLLEGRLVAFDSDAKGGGMLLTAHGEWVHPDKRLSLGRDCGTRVQIVAADHG